ncbi:MAG: cytochrome P450 [Bryobacteraceae bacterium]
MNVRLDKKHVDPLSPPPPVAPYRDPSREAWVLSRYADVLAAFREPRLQLGRGRNEDSPEISDPSLQLRVRIETLAAFSAANLARWQLQVERLAFALIDQLPDSRAVDIVQEFARPLSLATAIIVTGANPTDSERLGELAGQVSLAAADPSNSALQHNVIAADMELERSLQNSPIPMGGPAFVALSQTLPCFLANAWLTLLRNPSELARLRNQPNLMPRAIEELLRYAGVAHKVSRHAVAPVTLGNISIEQGGRVILMLASANRDPEQFSVPDRLDLTRRIAGHVAFGVGPHSCVGAFLIRTMAALATRVFIERFAESQSNEPIEWHGGSGFRWAASLYVFLRRDGHTG